MKYGRYPAKLKKRMVSRYLQEPEMGIGEFCSDNGIPESNLRDWIRQAENGTLDNMKKQKHVNNWTIAEKFKAIQEFNKIDEQEQGKWLRSHGISLNRIEKWNNEIQDSLQGISRKPSKEENSKIKKLEKELKVKDKALAEASAILFAKKKLDAMYGGEDEEN